MKPAARFLATLFARSKAPVFVTSLANDKGQSQRLPSRSIVTRECDTVERFAAKWDQLERALYFCVGTIKPGSQRRARETVAELVCLHADLDLKTVDASRTEIDAALKRLRCRPQLVVFSGHGLHCYWLLDAGLQATPKNVARVEAALKTLANVLAGDSLVCHVAALMRLPGSHNSKNGEWIEVRVLEQRKGRYTLEQLERWLAKATPVLRRKHKPQRQNGGDNPWLKFGAAHTFVAPIDVERRLAEMQYRGPDENGIHNTQLSVTAALLRRGFAIEDVVARVLRETIAAAGPEGRGWNWRQEERDLRAMCRSWLAKHPQRVCVEVMGRVVELYED
jgi:hypothetical protein